MGREYNIPESWIKTSIDEIIINQKGKMVEMLGKIILADGSVTAEGKTIVALQD